MTASTAKPNDLLSRLDQLNAQELRRLLVEHLTSRKLGLTWERNAIDHDAALNADVVLPRLVLELSHRHGTDAQSERAKDDAPVEFVNRNLIIEGDNFDSLRLLKATHAGRIRVIYIDPPYNTGNKDWVYNDKYVGEKDRWRHSQWLEFLFQRLTLARDLLTPDGVILVSINDENRSKLEMLMDEVFPGRRLGTFVWKTRSGSNDESGGRLSLDHEHVLIYANPKFSFRGDTKDDTLYKNTDGDPRGRWKTGDLSKSHNYMERPNGYYPIQNPKNGVWYPCNPSRVWAFSSEEEIRRRLNGDQTAVDKELAALRAKTMEQYIREEKVIFPDPSTERVVVWETMDELLAAIDAEDVPLRPKNKTPLLTRGLPDLEFWVGKAVGFGRPWFKRHLADLQSEVRPVSSWIRGAVEDENLDEFTVGLTAQRSGTGEHSANEILGFNAFPFPKPASLLRSLLSQATRSDDIVLDFFAGSGTTAHAVLELNAEDGGNRRYILCSSTEATQKEPDKNICRDITAERMRRVSAGYAGKAGYTAEQGGEFAYLQLDKVAVADLAYEARMENAMALLSLQLTHAVWPATAGPVQHIARADGCDILLCMKVDPDSVKVLAGWPNAHGVERLAVYSERPQALQESLEAQGIEATCHSLHEALLSGQAGGQA